MSYVLIREAQQVARKPHRCIWCADRINVGERYVYERSVYDGQPQSLHWHLECRAEAILRWKFDPYDCEFSPGENERPASAASLEYESWLAIDTAAKQTTGDSP